MNPSRVASPCLVARMLAATIFLVLLLAICQTSSLGDTGPAQPGPAETAPTGPANGSQLQQVAHPRRPVQVQPGMHVERQVLSPSGKLRIQYLRDRQHGIREIALQDANNSANTTILAQYRRNAWVVISPNDDWLVLNTRDGRDNGAQLYHRVSAAPLKYEVPPGLQGNGGTLQDLAWQAYLAETRQDPKTDRSRVTIDGIAWDSDSQQITLSVAPIATKNDAALPEPWTCLYDVTKTEIELAADVAEGPADSAPNQSDEASSATEEVQAGASDEQSSDLEGERFPATRGESITMENANELELSDIRYAINEMLARHGANFKDAKVRETFAQFSWYQPRADVSLEQVENEFSDIEKHNIAVLRRCRDAKVAAAHRPERKAIRGEPVEEPDAQKALRGIMQGVSDALNGGR